MHARTRRHGYGLVQFGMVAPFLLQLYAEIAHDCSRGSWTCFEQRVIPNYTPPGGCVVLNPTLPRQYFFKPRVARPGRATFLPFVIPTCISKTKMLTSSFLYIKGTQRQHNLWFLFTSSGCSCSKIRSMARLHCTYMLCPRVTCSVRQCMYTSVMSEHRLHLLKAPGFKTFFKNSNGKMVNNDGVHASKT